MRGFDAMDPSMRLVPAASKLRLAGLTTLGLAVICGGLVLVVFDWQPLDVLSGTALGVFLWGALSFLTEVQGEIPQAEALPPAPPDAAVEHASVLRRRLLLAAPFCVALAWLADRWDLGAVFVPGQFAGAAAANLLGAVFVTRWQDTHGGRVLTRRDAPGETELYSGGGQLPSGRV
jgi:hypothetical protein